jgi:hypothetical protein
MPANNINVSLTKDGLKHLDVEDHGGIHVPKSDKETPITWHLNGEAAKGKFVAMDCAEPGFSWVTKKPPPEQANGGPFGPATVINGGNGLTISDNHTTAQSNGEWIYMLRVDMGAKGIYTTTATARGVVDTVNNPIIINREE